jgi:hypothetical protein
MFLHLGNNVVVNTNSIIGIFDIENTSTSQMTKNFLSNTKNKKIINVNYEMPKTFVVCEEDGVESIYITSIATSTLKKRFLLNNVYL